MRSFPPFSDACATYGDVHAYDDVCDYEITRSHTYCIARLVNGRSYTHHSNEIIENGSYQTRAREETSRLVFMQGPAMDCALALLEQAQAAVDVVGQSHWQSSDERQQSHDSASLLIVGLEPPLSFRVQGIFVQGLT